jgi:hypothetical protein
MVFHSINNHLGGQAIELTWYIHWIPFYQEWEPRRNEEDAHPLFEGMGSWL